MKIFKSDNIISDFWGGLASMLVALPSAIAFGVSIYSVLGSQYIATGALSGILGVIALGIITPIFGGTNLLVSAPCAPAAAVISGFVIEKMSIGGNADNILILIMLMGFLSGIFQVSFGFLGLGTLIKFMPYPVVSGYLSGVGLYIIASQTPKFLGAPKNAHFWESILNSDLWKWQSIVLGIFTIFSMIIAPKITKKVPPVIISLLSGLFCYLILTFIDKSLLIQENNPFIVGAISSNNTGNFFQELIKKLACIKNVELSDIYDLLLPSLTLAVLLSIDTLKTCIVIDALTHSRHKSNKELIGQGLGNIASAFIGGVNGAGTMGATLVNISSGASSRLSSLIEGIFATLAFLFLGSLISWVPIASLAGILCVIGAKMIDKNSLNFFRNSSTKLDFLVIIAVILTSLTVSLIMASAVGVLLAVLLFIREQISTSIIHKKSYGNQVSSKHVRVAKEVELLKKYGNALAIYELQGSLFFGTANQLYSNLEKDLNEKKYIILDMKRVQSVDLTAAHILEQIEEVLTQKKAFLIFSRVPKTLPTGQDVQNYLGEVGLVKEESKVKIFNDIDDAIEWVENDIIKNNITEEIDEKLLELNDFELFKGRKATTVADLEAKIKICSYKAGEKIFSCGDRGDELYFIRKGTVSIVLPISESESYHLSTFGKGNFFGEMSFLDGVNRSASAFADTDIELFILSRENFETFAEEHRSSGIYFLEGLASVLAGRLRLTNSELRALDS
ncbi:MAG: SulP family inorganic anion transporter [Candidatus Sericytochromatia bacterium]